MYDGKLIYPLCQKNIYIMLSLLKLMYDGKYHFLRKGLVTTKKIELSKKKIKDKKNQIHL